MRNSSTVIEMTNRGQNILCGSEFSLYIPRSPHRRVRSLLRGLSGFFVARITTSDGALLKKCPRLTS
jgi:hypothetical protein